MAIMQGRACGARLEAVDEVADRVHLRHGLHAVGRVERAARAQAAQERRLLPACHGREHGVQGGQPREAPVAVAHGVGLRRAGLLRVQALRGRPCTSHQNRML